jgi:hypothetical protein
MTEKAQAVLQKLRQRRAPKQWKRLNNPERRVKILNDFNLSSDPVGPVPGASGDKFLKELNEMADLERDAGRKSSDR